MDEIIKEESGMNPVPEVKVITPTQTEGKKFTQEALDYLVENRLAKERNKIFKKLGVEDESKIDEILERSKKYDSLETELNILKQEKETQKYTDELRKLNVDDSFLDYVFSKVEKGEKFAESAKTFVDANPKFLKESFSTMNSGLSLQGNNNAPDLDKMTAEEYYDWKMKKK